MKKALVGGIGAVLIGGAGVWIYFSGSASVPSSGDSATTSAPAAWRELAPSKGGAPAASIQPSGIHSSGPPTAVTPFAGSPFKEPEVVKASAVTGNLRSVYDQYRQLAKTDGDTAFFLEDVLRSCVFATFGGRAEAEARMLKGTYSEDIQRLRKRAYDELWTKCREFEGFAAYDQDVSELTKSANANGSKAMKARMLLLAPPGEQRTAQAKALLESGDPYALMELAPLLAGNLNVQEALTPLEGAGNFTVFKHAFMLASCDLGFRCDEWRLPAMCIDSGTCLSPTYQAALQQTVLSPRDFELAMRYRGRITQAIQTRNWGLFGL